jgi:hypothetical protein
MTQVRIGILSPTSDGTGKRPTGTLAWKPTKRRTVGDDVVIPAEFTVGLTDPPPVVEIAPTEPGWAWTVVERVSGGSPKARYLAVPDSATVVDYADLIAVDPATLDPLEEPEADWWAALANIGTFATDPTDADALLVTSTAATIDPSDADALVLIGE